MSFTVLLGKTDPLFAYTFAFTYACGAAGIKGFCIGCYVIEICEKKSLLYAKCCASTFLKII